MDREVRSRLRGGRLAAAVGEGVGPTASSRLCRASSSLRCLVVSVHVGGKLDRGSITDFERLVGRPGRRGGCGSGNRGGGLFGEHPFFRFHSCPMLSEIPHPQPASSRVVRPRQSGTLKVRYMYVLRVKSGGNLTYVGRYLCQLSSHSRRPLRRDPSSRVDWHGSIA